MAANQCLHITPGGYVPVLWEPCQDSQLQLQRSSAHTHTPCIQTMSPQSSEQDAGKISQNSSVYYKYTDVPVLYSLIYSWSMCLDHQTFRHNEFIIFHHLLHVHVAYR